MSENNILLLTDVLENRAQKQKELEFYQAQLEEIQNKMYWLNRDLQLTNTIIKIIEDEMVVDLKEQSITKMLESEQKTPTEE